MFWGVGVRVSVGEVVRMSRGEAVGQSGGEGARVWGRNFLGKQRKGCWIQWGRGCYGEREGVRVGGGEIVRGRGCWGERHMTWVRL